MFDTEKKSWARVIQHFRFDATDKAQSNWAGDSHETDFWPLGLIVPSSPLLYIPKRRIPVG